MHFSSVVAIKVLNTNLCVFQVTRLVCDLRLEEKLNEEKKNGKEKEDVGDEESGKKRLEKHGR